MRGIRGSDGGRLCHRLCMEIQPLRESSCIGSWVTGSCRYINRHLVQSSPGYQRDHIISFNYCSVYFFDYADDTEKTLELGGIEDDKAEYKRQGQEK